MKKKETSYLEPSSIKGKRITQSPVYSIPDRTLETKWVFQGGNFLSGFTITLDDVLTRTVQSSIIEVEVIIKIDGVIVPYSIYSENIALETLS